jgi:hypothetical protein
MFLVKNHDPKKSKGTDHADFYVQSKGSDAGKPLKEPSANCFAVITDNSRLLPDYFYYMVLAAWQQGTFRPYLRGSVIPFLTIDNFNKALLKKYGKP